MKTAIYLLIFLSCAATSCKKKYEEPEDKLGLFCRTWEIKYGHDAGKRITFYPNGTGSYAEGSDITTSDGSTTTVTPGGPMIWYFTQNQDYFTIHLTNSGIELTQGISILNANELRFFQEPTKGYFDLKVVSQ